jgi:hypothetical protein
MQEEYEYEGEVEQETEVYEGDDGSFEEVIDTQEVEEVEEVDADGQVTETYESYESEVRVLCHISPPPPQLLQAPHIPFFRRSRHSLLPNLNPFREAESKNKL